MNTTSYFELMSRYNQWMNKSVYAAANQLDAQALREDRGAFFGSILGTLNHIMVGDIVWLKRFADQPAQFESLDPVREMQKPAALDAILYSDFAALRQARTQLDETIINFCSELSPEHLGYTLNYASMLGGNHKKQFGFLLQHFFNHQTHHRGQVTTLLSQCGLDVGVTDLLAIVPDAS